MQQERSIHPVNRTALFLGRLYVLCTHVMPSKYADIGKVAKSPIVCPLIKVNSHEPDVIVCHWLIEKFGCGCMRGN